jgi:hypothetical protein
MSFALRQPALAGSGGIGILRVDNRQHANLLPLEDGQISGGVIESHADHARNLKLLSCGDACL